MILQIEIPDDWIKRRVDWKSTQIMVCSQCDYRTPVPALFVTHVYNVHGTYKDEEPTLTLDP